MLVSIFTFTCHKMAFHKQLVENMPQFGLRIHEESLMRLDMRKRQCSNRRKRQCSNRKIRANDQEVEILSIMMDCSWLTWPFQMWSKLTLWSCHNFTNEATVIFTILLVFLHILFLLPLFFFSFNKIYILQWLRKQPQMKIKSNLSRYQNASPILGSLSTWTQLYKIQYKS